MVVMMIVVVVVVVISSSSSSPPQQSSLSKPRDKSHRSFDRGLFVSLGILLQRRQHPSIILSLDDTEHTGPFHIARLRFHPTLVRINHCGLQDVALSGIIRSTDPLGQ